MCRRYLCISEIMTTVTYREWSTLLILKKMRRPLMESVFLFLSSLCAKTSAQHQVFLFVHTGIIHHIHNQPSRSRSIISNTKFIMTSIQIPLHQDQIQSLTSSIIVPMFQDQFISVILWHQPKHHCSRMALKSTLLSLASILPLIITSDCARLKIKSLQIFGN